MKVNGQVKKPHREEPLDSIVLSFSNELFSPDSILIGTKNKYHNLLQKASEKVIKYPGRNLKKLLKDSITKTFYNQFRLGRPLVEIKSGYFNYNYAYRSYLDTPFLESNIQQHVANISANLIIGQKFPFRVSVYNRSTNSVYFKNYTDVRIEFNAPEFRRLKAERLEKYFNALTENLQNPNIKSELEILKKILSEKRKFTNRPEIIKRFLESKETVINKDNISGSPEYKDSVIKEAGAFVALYEKEQKNIRSAGNSYDSLRKEYVLNTKQMRELGKIFKSNIAFPGGTKIIKESLNKAGLHDKHFEGLLTSLYSVRTLSIGRTQPSYTNLTINNISVNGINTEFNYKNLYVAFVAGLIDFRLRDFVISKYKNQSSSQFVTAARIGWGRKERNHIILTGYHGRKQIFSSQTSYHPVPIFGLSLESQFELNRNIRFIAEVAQSSIAYSKDFLNDSLKNGFSLRDNNARAFSLQAFSYFPRTRTRIYGKYEHQGINFQCFNVYKPNASTNAWNIKADQYFLSGILHLTASIQKNDYENPAILQNYNSNTIFTTINATLRKRFWPVISFGYIPSSQYTIINNQVYESRYQAFNITMNHTYKLGIVNATSSIMYNRFYNDRKDSGFIYYNAQNLAINQNIIFEKFSANIGISHTQNSQYFLDVMRAGINKTIFKKNSIGCGIKLNHINTQENKFGYYINTKIKINKVGVLNLMAERGYFPGVGNNLIKNEFFNIGFLRYFN